jgi:hypothetical protein
MEPPKTNLEPRQTDMESPEVMKLLENAHTAHESGDFINADRFYARFFDESRVVDPMAFYAIRLNNCLMAWTKLSQDFPGARVSLEQKGQQMLAEYQRSGEPERFHDYAAIAKQLKGTPEVLEIFITLHDTAPERAQKLAKYVWTDLLGAQEWRVCSELMTRPEQKLDELFAVFDQAAQMKDLDERFNTIEFDEHIVDTLLGDVQLLVEVLRRTERSEEVVPLARQFQQGVEQRDHATLAKKVHAQGSYLFVGH